MANKYYLDEAGLNRLVEYIRQQLTPVEVNTNAIELLNKTDGTPGSIKKMIQDAIEQIDIADLMQSEPIALYGGSPFDVFEEGTL